jgi:beta-galactosidase
MNGANYYDTSFYQPEISSYDYDAPLDEAGNATEKFMVFRKVIERHLPAGQYLPDVAASKKTIALPTITFKQQAPIVNMLPRPKEALKPLTFEDLHQGYGYVLYRTRIKGGDSGVLSLKELRDYAIVFINGKRKGILSRMQKLDSLWVSIPRGEATLDILVENLGRINFGPDLLKNRKGITEKVLFNQKELTGWKMYSLPFDQIDSMKFAGTRVSTELPVLKRATFQLGTIGDTYLDMSAWGKGCVWVNGHHLGRYWEIGPQQTLYVPVEWLKKGTNVIEVLELIKPGQNEIRSVEKPILSALTAAAGSPSR